MKATNAFRLFSTEYAALAGKILLRLSSDFKFNDLEFYVEDNLNITIYDEMKLPLLYLFASQGDSSNGEGVCYRISYPDTRVVGESQFTHFLACALYAIPDTGVKFCDFSELARSIDIVNQKIESGYDCNKKMAIPQPVNVLATVPRQVYADEGLTEAIQVSSIVEGNPPPWLYRRELPKTASLLGEFATTGDLEYAIEIVVSKNSYDLKSDDLSSTTVKLAKLSDWIIRVFSTSGFEDNLFIVGDRDFNIY